MRLPPSVRGSLPTELQPIQKSKISHFRRIQWICTVLVRFSVVVLALAWLWQPSGGCVARYVRCRCFGTLRGA